MDPLTHGLAAGLVACALGVPELIPFAVAGSMTVDADTFVYCALGNRPGNTEPTAEVSRTEGAVL